MVGQESEQRGDRRRNIASGNIQVSVAFHDGNGVDFVLGQTEDAFFRPKQFVGGWHAGTDVIFTGLVFFGGNHLKLGFYQPSQILCQSPGGIDFRLAGIIGSHNTGLRRHFKGRQTCAAGA